MSRRESCRSRKSEISTRWRLPSEITNKKLKNKLVRIYQPTYQLNSRRPFKEDIVQKILKRIVDSELETVEYSDKVVPELCNNLAENIRNTVKEENYDRVNNIDLLLKASTPLVSNSVEAQISQQLLRRGAFKYRILVAVTIGQRRQQSVQMYHSFIWDHERDRFASYNFENSHIFANVVVYGIYFD